MAGELQRSRSLHLRWGKKCDAILVRRRERLQQFQQPPPSAGVDAAPDGNSGKRARIEAPSKPSKLGLKVLKGLKPCNGFNHGRCHGDAGKVCPKNDSFATNAANAAA